MKLLFKSIRWQIQMWYGLLLFVIIGAFGFIAIQLIWFNLLGDVDKELRENNSIIVVNLPRSALTDPSLDSSLRAMRAKNENAVTEILLERLAKGEIEAA